MALDKLTQITSTGINSTTPLNGISVSGIVTGGAATFDSVDVLGVITYDDVTNIDALGIITARTGIDVNADGINIDAGGLNISSGVSTIPVITGVTTIASNVVVGGGNTELVVTGDARITGILTVGTSTLKIDGTTSKISYDAIDESKTDDVVDLMVYDTRRDSDRGAWRKNTSSLSWYNETLNTATRGSRREFPQVALIAAETDKITIYDADDPSLPMWMVFNQSSGYHISTSDSPRLLDMVNGILLWSSGTGLHSVFFLADKKQRRSTSGIHGTAGNIENRNANTAESLISADPRHKLSHNDLTGLTALVNNHYEHDKYRGLHDDTYQGAFLNIPTTDPSTGLRSPSVAVGSYSGSGFAGKLNVIVGLAATMTVGFGSEATAEANTTTNTPRFSRSVIPGTDKFFTHLYSGTTSPVYVYDAGLLPNASTGANGQALMDFYDSGQIGHGGSRNAYIASADGISDMCFGGNAIGIGTRMETLIGVANTAIAGSLNFVLPPLDYPQAATSEAGAVCAITTSYCTGYQFGKPIFAGLCNTQTSTSGISSSAVLTGVIENGDFSNGTTGWTVYNGVSTLSVSSGQLTIDRNGSAEATGQCVQVIDTVPGKGYAVTLDVVSHTNTYQIYFATEGASNATNAVPHAQDHNRSMTWSFTAQASRTEMHLAATGNINGTVTVDNVTIREIEANNRNLEHPGGVEIKGTVTKKPVAPGADLQCYGGFSPDNYLIQQYDSELNFGTNDFYVMGWFRTNGENGSGTQRLYRRGFRDSGAWSDGIFSGYITGTGTAGCNLTADGFSNTNTVTGITTCSDGNWHHFAQVRQTNGNVGGHYLYIDGKADAVNTDNAGSNSYTSDVTSVAPASLIFGGDQLEHSNIMFEGELALWRVGAGAPTPGDISKIYEAEKVLFQPNAKCTLYGDSNGVTGLAYDSKLDTYYVGTSSGRSDFKGLRRINNTTTGITSAISAYDGFIAEQ